MIRLYVAVKMTSVVASVSNIFAQADPLPEHGIDGRPFWREQGYEVYELLADPAQEPSISSTEGAQS